MKQLLPIIALVIATSLAWGQTNSSSQNGSNSSASPSASAQSGASANQNGASASQSRSTQAGQQGNQSTGSQTSGSTANQAGNQTGMQGLFSSGQSVTFVTQSGQNLDEASAMARIRSGACMRMQMAGNGSTVERVTIE